MNLYFRLFPHRVLSPQRQLKLSAWNNHPLPVIYAAAERFKENQFFADVFGESERVAVSGSCFAPLNFGLTSRTSQSGRFPLKNKYLEGKVGWVGASRCAIVQ